MSARKNILNRLKSANSTKDNALQNQELDRSWYSKHGWDDATQLENFIERMEAVRAEIHQSSADAWPKLLAELCEKKLCSNLLISNESHWADSSQNQSDLPDILHYDKDIEEWKSQLFYEVDASLTSSLGGISETGSLIVWPTEDEPRMMSLVPPIHFVIMEKSKLHSTFAEAMREMDWSSQMPTNALLISGPSKSADIEQTLAYGVHGPKELVVIII